MTPRQLDIRSRAYADRLDQQMELVRIQSYLTGMIAAAFVKSKDGRSLTYDAIFGVEDKKSSDMSDEEMLRVVRSINAQLGGEDIEQQSERLTGDAAE